MPREEGSRKKSSKRKDRKIREEREAQKSRKVRRHQEDIDREEEDDSEENEQDISVAIDGARTMFYGVLKAGKGLVSLAAGIGMGASGLPAKKVYEILNSPMPDWPNLFKETWKEFSQDKTKLQMGRECFLGFFTGGGTSIINSVKEILTGAFQALGGGILVVKILKDYLGLKPEVIEAALKSGHPIGLIIGTIGTTVDRAQVFCNTLEEQLEKYKSLEEVGTKALDAIRSGNYKEVIEHGVATAEKLTGRDLSQLTQAASIAHKLYKASSNPEEMMKIVQEEVLPQAKNIVKILGIDPKHIEDIEAVQGKILFKEGFPPAQRLTAIKGILGENPSFGVIAQAVNFEDALKKLVAHKDLELVEKLSVVNIIGSPGQALSADNLERLKTEARRRLEPEISRQLQTGVSRELNKSKKFKEATRDLRDLKESKEQFERAMSSPSSMYIPSESNRPDKPSTRSPYHPPTSKPKKPRSPRPNQDNT